MYGLRISADVCLQKANAELNAELARVNLKLEEPLAVLTNEVNKEAQKKAINKLDSQFATQVSKKLTQGINPEVVDNINKKLNASVFNAQFTPVRIGNATKMTNLPRLINSALTGMKRSPFPSGARCSMSP